ncbi:MAG: permease prefix domain 1-containing protein [Microbacterium sp.]|uniref:permease prefix domain 1-containing protein n=1 Tax=Microbacterium sp. TaxID=51671 RepID=UPI0039E5F0B8
MNSVTLIDRYVDTAMRTVPGRQRSDLSAELRALIADQVDARVESGEAPDEAEVAVLTGLGDPDKLAAGYTGRQLHLIGPRYFLTWWRLLKVLLWVVLPGVALGVSLGLAINGGSVGGIVATAAVVLVHAAVHLGFWTTLLFAIIERMSAGAPSPWAVDSLPEPRLTDVSLVDVVGAVLIRLGLAGYLVFDHFVLPTLSSPNIDRGVSLFDADLWPVWMLGFFAVLGLDIALVVVVYLVGRWTTPLAVVRAILTAIGCAATIWLLVRGELVNPVILESLTDVSSGGVALSILTTVVAFGIVGIATWHTIHTFSKARA